MPLFYLNKATDLTQLGTLLREELARTGKSLEVNYKLARSKKTWLQISYFHVLINLIIAETGDKDVKIRMKDELGYYTEFYSKGETRRNYKSLANATLNDMIIFIESAINVCRFLDLTYQTIEQHKKEINYVQNGK